MVILTSFPPPTDGIRHKQESTVAHIDGKPIGNGTLYIAESRLSWMGENNQGFSLEYPSISLHAISRDTGTFPQECIYLMVDGKISDSAEVDTHSNSSEEEDENPVGEIRFIPSDKGTLDAIFNAMSACQALHPDPQDTDSEAEAEEDFYLGEEGLEHLTEDGQAQLQHLDSLLQEGQGDGIPVQTNHTNGAPGPALEEDMETGQFEDAVMDE